MKYSIHVFSLEEREEKVYELNKYSHWYFKNCSTDVAQLVTEEGASDFWALLKHQARCEHLTGSENRSPDPSPSDTRRIRPLNQRRIITWEKLSFPQTSAWGYSMQNSACNRFKIKFNSSLQTLYWFVPSLPWQSLKNCAPRDRVMRIFGIILSTLPKRVSLVNYQPQTSMDIWKWTDVT